jgi:hypothetical protein
VNLVGSFGLPYNNPVRAGYSLDPGDLANGQPRDSADDNFNSFDPYPFGHSGEVGDLDFLDTMGALILPVERMRRYVTPADINGTGSIVQWNGTTATPGTNLGGDQWGRVEFNSYFRAPGLPGQVGFTPTAGYTNPYFTMPVTFPNWPTTAPLAPYPVNIVTSANVTANPPTAHDSNPLHGFESQRFPNLQYSPPPPPPPRFTPQRVGGVPVDINQNANQFFLPGQVPTYDVSVNSKPNTNSDGLNEADEMNLYHLNAQHDSPYGFADLEWLYRQQDVDGASLTSRLAQLAPISFANTVDSQRRRRLFALDSWDLNSYSWANDNPGGVLFNYNSRFAYNAASVPPVYANAGFATLNVPSWTNPNIAALNNPTLAAPSPAFSLAHRDKKINLNYPLPVSNDPDEAVRQKWITDTYQTLKAVLPPRSVDTAEELAQLSQFVINIVDFRDPDSAMTHWVNPDVWFRVGTAPTPGLRTTSTNPMLVLTSAKAATDLPLNQYGMEYNPIAINETLAYSFQTSATASTSRLFIELVNTLTSPELGSTTAPGLGTGMNNASVLDLAGFQSGTTVPWDGGCWDILFTADDPASAPDPFTGQLQQGGTYYSLTPLVTATFSNLTAPADPLIYPLPQTPGAGAATVNAGNMFTGVSPPYPVAPYYFLTIGPGTTATETVPVPVNLAFNTTWDPLNNAASGNQVSPGVMPNTAAGAPVLTYPQKILNGVAPPVSSAQFYWVCLRRPANPFAPVTAKNPMIVVDAMRFPYIEGGVTPPAGTTPPKQANYFYSSQRLQPYRGGHAVPAPGAATAIDTRYGYTEQIAVPTSIYTDQGIYSNGQNIQGPGGAPATTAFYHTLGYPNDGGSTFTQPLTAASTVTTNEEWTYFPFNDRDFTSVAELMLVPGCPPGLFTKQFVEFAPSTTSATTYFTPAATATHQAGVIGGNLPSIGGATNPGTATAALFSASLATNPVLPYTFPYLNDKFFYSAAGAVTSTANFVNDQSGDGWYKMFEFFEVPSQMNGAVDRVAYGVNFDWMRQDTKPGLINLNLIIDEEVFFSVFGKQNEALNHQVSPLYEQLLCFDQLQPPAAGPVTGGSLAAGTLALPLASGSTPIPLVVTAVTANGSPAAVYPMSNTGVVAMDPLTLTVGNSMKTSFAQFLSLRHGGSGFVFGYGIAATGQNTAVALPTPNPNNLAPSGIPLDRPFHSLSYPDINLTVMRPAALPPSTFTDPVLQIGAVANYSGDPAYKNPFLYPGYVTGAAPNSTSAALVLPPAIPTRRLFQLPDNYSATLPASNASEKGDPYINNLSPLLVTGNPTTGALPPFVNAAGTTVVPNSGVVNLFWPGTNTPTPTGNPDVKNPYLGVGAGTGVASVDDRQHPYWRSEMMQKAMNLTTVRTHQYAVWITIGFFQVLRQGDLWMLQTNPTNAYDIMGPELGDASGQTTRFRSFFIVDRLQLPKFDDKTPDSFRPAVVYRRTIE